MASDEQQPARSPLHVVELANDQDEWVEPLPFIRKFLREKSAVFKELEAVRDQGTKSKQGDKYFENQRDRADNADAEQQKFYFDMMYTIGLDLENQTNALKLEKKNPLIIDTCLAPGGFAKVVLDLNPTAKICAMTLHENVGGHSVAISAEDTKGRMDVRFIDITMLGIECGLRPKDIREGMSSETLYAGKGFDLAICDGQLLRQNKSHRDAVLEGTAAWKLTYSQLIFAMNRLVKGANLVVLLHKIEAWENIRLIATISKFSDVKLFKHAGYHGSRSSCYLVAKGVQTDSELAHTALSDWKGYWRECAFGSVGDSSENPAPEFVQASDIKAVLEDFGDEFIKLAEPIWSTQMTAIRRAPWFPKNLPIRTKESRKRQIYAKDSWRSGAE